MPVVTIAVLHSKASRSALLSLLVLLASGCGNNSSVTPTPLPPAPSVTVRLEGRVLDEHDQPVEGARITLTYIHPGGPIASSGPTAPSITADDTGAFSLILNLPANWQRLTLRVDREGYESDARIFVEARAIRALLINMYRSLTISPGQSIQTAVSLRSLYCGFEGNPCRRVIVNSPPGKLVDLEVIPADGQEYAGLAVRDQVALGYDFPRRLTVSGGDEVWIVVGQLGRVTLRADGQ
jgi:hypothetical protein